MIWENTRDEEERRKNTIRIQRRFIMEKLIFPLYLVQIYKFVLELKDVQIIRSNKFYFFPYLFESDDIFIILSLCFCNFVTIMNY